MRRITFSLPEDLAAALESQAARERAPVSQVVRQAIEAKLGWDEVGERELPFIGMADSGWTPESGEMPLSEYIDTDEFKKEYADWIYRDSFNRDP